MTVGLAAACNGGDDPQVVIAADRMITSGHATRIEYEHTKSKLDEVVDNQSASVDGVHCMAASSGTVSYVDKFFTKLKSKVRNTEPAGVEHIATMGAEVIQEMTRDRANRQVLNQFGISLEDLRNGRVAMEEDTIHNLLGEISNERGTILSQLDVLFAGIDHTGSNIYSIPDGNVSPHNRIGYHSIGSGRQPARSSFIRSRYDEDCSIEETLLSVTEAKRQSEEAQGVGAEMDIAIVSGSRGCYNLSNETETTDGENSEVEELLELHNRVAQAEMDAREEAIADADYDF